MARRRGHAGHCVTLNPRAGFGPVPMLLGGDAGEVEADDAGQDQAD
jgi:hypothetical protein